MFWTSRIRDVLRTTWPWWSQWLKRSRRWDSKELLRLLCNFQLIQSWKSYWNCHVERNGANQKRKKGWGGGTTGTGEFWSVMKEKGEKGVKVVFSLKEWRWRCVCVFGLSFSGPENKIHLARSLHLSQRNNTNSISPCRVIRSVIYRFWLQICTLGNCFVVLQQRWHTGLSLQSRQHRSPFQCVPTLAKSMLASVAVMEMCTLTKPVTQWVVKSDGVLLCLLALVEKVQFILCMCYLTDSRSTSKLPIVWHLNH